MKIRRAVVIGSGVMGSGIAAALTGTGIEVKLIDIVPELTNSDLNKGLSSDNPRFRSKLAQNAIQKQLKSRMSNFYTPLDASSISPGNIEDDLEAISMADWIIEAVTENIVIKNKVFELVEKHRRSDSIISSNTSGIPLALMTATRTDSFQKHFLITHFFNPPRFMHLLELIRGPQTQHQVYRCIEHFTVEKMGKGIVDCRDTPGFIANRIGCYDLLISVQTAEKFALSPAEADLLSGPLCGRPKSGTYRLLDVIGLDTISFVIENLGNSLKEDECRSTFKVSDQIKKMIELGLLGEKSQKGFYCKSKEGIQSLNPSSYEYENCDTSNLKKEISQYRKISDPRERLATILQEDNLVSNYLWEILSSTSCYAVHRLGEIASEPYEIDRAMCWGYRHEIGPFEFIDILGVDAFCQKLLENGDDVPRLLLEMQNKDINSFYTWQSAKQLCLDPKTLQYKEPQTARGSMQIKSLKLLGRTVCEKAQLTAIDAGGGCLLIEMHGKRNSFNMQMVKDMTELVEMAEKTHSSIVIVTEQNDFSVGADLTEMIGAAQQGRLDDFMQAITNFQEMSMTIRHASVPVVAAVRGFVFGGGCELAIHCDALQISPETYMGLVEAGVGLLPAGAGCKELARRAEGNYTKLYDAFETVAMAKVTGSGRALCESPFFKSDCGLTLNEDRLIHDAILRAQMLASQGYRTPNRNDKIKVCGSDALAELRVRLNIMASSGFISPHDKLIADKIAFAMCGGDIPTGSLVSQDYMLKLEREAFLSLLNEEKTKERIEYTLKNGKPLRN